VTRLASALAERYRIERELGAGGMATVYLAEDLKHKRKVAVKVLKPELAAVLGAERFVQEITTTAALQHPHILPLFDSGTADGFLYYVMPFIDGETLRSKLDRETQLGVEEAVRIASDVADALHYAHQHGVIHRDIKPENILLANGRPMVADFGIALAVSAAAGGRMTETGLSLGTPHYMSPEQATAEKEITGRSDIYSLASVLYEMLTGEPPHMGNSAQQIIMKIITEPAAPVTKLRKSVPPNVAAAVGQALEKLPADRFGSAQAFATALHDSSFRTATGTAGEGWTATRGGTRLTFVSMAVAITALVALGVVGWTSYRRAPAATLAPVQFVVTAKGVAEPVYTLTWPAVASPDNRTIVYAGAMPNGTYQYYARDVGHLESRPVPGTLGASQPVFSPDGQWLAFQAQDSKVKKVRLDGGAPIPLAEYSQGNGMAWSSRGTIVVGAGMNSFGLSRFSENGGALTSLTKPDSVKDAALWHVWPVMLADGQTIIFSLWKQFNPERRSELAVTSLDDGVVHPLGVYGARALGVSGDVLVYLTFDGVVMATRVDLPAYRAVGSPIALVDSIPVCPTCNGDGAATLSSNGALAHMRGSSRGRLTWRGKDHVDEDAGFEPGVMLTPRLSPDGSRIALEVDADSRKDIWIYQIANHTIGKLTNEGDNSDPEWSSDGGSIHFLSSRNGKTALWRQPIDGTGDAREILSTGSGFEWGIAVAPDQEHVILQSSLSAGVGLYSAPLGADGTRQPFSNVNYGAWAPRFSPNGRWVTYVSDESGREEVFVRPFPGPGAPVQISVAGGSHPVWSRDGLRLYYIAGNQMTAATLTPEPTFSVASRDSLFSGAFSTTKFSLSSYDVARDGRILMIKPNDDHLQLVVTLNWMSDVAARIAKP
jgi:eukaryotic-like serine/threonine-protein kinase